MGLQDVKEGKDFSFPEEESVVLKLWDEIDAFKEQLRLTEGMPEYIFYDGPPFATGLPHYGHILAGTIKDIVTRYASMNGHHVIRRFGWDTHGLPVEYEIDKKLGITSRDDVLKLGIDKYNEECRSIVMRYSSEWERTVTRLGRWIDFRNDYKTLYPWYMESIWWVFKQLFDKNLVYRGYKVMPYSTACSTPLSNFEAGLNYKDVPDPAVMVAFPIVNDPDGAAFVAWTTTPWTLPSNLALCVNPAFTYVRCKDPKTGNVYVVGESRLGAIPGATKKKGKKGKPDEPGWEVVGKCTGAELVGLEYEPLFPYYAERKGRSFKVCGDAYVTDDSGTGVVHQAPAFGEDDNRVCMAHGIVSKGEELPCPVDASGVFVAPVTDFAGMYVKDADKAIIHAVKERGLLVDHSTMTHSYPFCWRSDTPLIYRTVPSWFVRVEEIKPRLLKSNEQTYWVPSYVKEKRFHNWLESAHDWAISRSRFWGTPLPIWLSDDGEEVVVVGSKAELEELTGAKVDDLHRHFIDHLTIPSRQGKGVLRRVDDVFDCWFESGSMPYAYMHYPFENKELFENNFPADFIAEGIDQTRGWFYTLMVLSTALFDRPAFKNLVCNGLVLAADGKKMSKRLQNYPDPNLVIERYGADALRLYLINSPVVRAETLRFKEEGVFAVVKDVFLPWYNAYRFFVQNALRLERDSGQPLAVPAGHHGWPKPTSHAGEQPNVLDSWIEAATRRLEAYVQQEMNAYRLYTVVPYLVKFIDDLTNVYVRYNRKRLKGAGGEADCRMALGVLYRVLLAVCRVMAPITPFFTEHMYQNLRQLVPELPRSVHWVVHPMEVEAAEAGDAEMVESVSLMQRVIEQVRVIRERHAKPVKMPLGRMVLVHPDAALLSALTGRLAEYVREETNVKTLEVTTDQLQYCSVRAQPDWNALGPRLGKEMGKVAKVIKGWTTEQAMAFSKAGGGEIEGHALTKDDVSLVRDFKRPAGLSEADIDAHGDGDLLVVLDLQVDEALMDAWLGRELASRVQKLRKSAGLLPADKVDVFYEAQGGCAEVLARVAERAADQIVDTIGVPLLPSSARVPQHALIASEAVSVGDAALNLKADCTLVLCRPTAVLARDAVATDCGCDDAALAGLQALVASRDPQLLAQEGRSGPVRVVMDGREVALTAGKHFFMSASEAAAARA
ncbi:unnamed protein product [Pedinophyceae sp. YPF-701]|nr:unnamed protein product [Pedinophyceae sp. YPF-701]